MESLCEKIETVKLHKFKNNVDKRLSYVEEHYNKILDNHSTCKSILCCTFNALLSGPCLDFNNLVKAIKGNVDSGIVPQAEITFEKLVIASGRSA